MVAVRYLRARRQEGSLSVMAIFAMIGIALGVATLIVVMAVMNGFRADLLSRILGINGHLTVFADQGPIREFDEFTDRLRAVEPWEGSYLANPRYLDASVSRLVKVLPPRNFGPCIKRSFLLLDLWSRCGLEPRIHLGTHKSDGEHRFHAWVTVPGSADPASDYEEIWSY